MAKVIDLLAIELQETFGDWNEAPQDLDVVEDIGQVIEPGAAWLFHEEKGEPCAITKGGMFELL